MTSNLCSHHSLLFCFAFSSRFLRPCAPVRAATHFLWWKTWLSSALRSKAGRWLYTQPAQRTWTLRYRGLQIWRAGWKLWILAECEFAWRSRDSSLIRRALQRTLWWSLRRSRLRFSFQYEHGSKRLRSVAEHPRMKSFELLCKSEIFDHLHKLYCAGERYRQFLYDSYSTGTWPAEHWSWRPVFNDRYLYFLMPQFLLSHIQQRTIRWGAFLFSHRFFRILFCPCLGTLSRKLRIRHVLWNWCNDS